MADRWAPVMTFVQLARLILMCIVWDSLSTTSRAYFESTSFHDLRPLELYNEAVKTQSKGEFANAISMYLQALEMFPEFPEAHQNLGHLYDHQNDLIAARLHHKASVKYASSAKFNASAIVNLVLVERKLQPLQDKPQLLRLSALLDEAELLEPSNVNVIFTHALIYEQLGEAQLCTAKLKRVIVLDDRHSLAWLNLGNQWFRANDFDVAAKFYKNALERLPEWDVYNRVLVLNNLGQCYRERGQFRLAYEAFHGALKTIQATNADADALPNVTDSSVKEGEESTNHAKVADDYSGGRYDGKAVHFWCINNLYTIQGMLCDWRGFEALEQHISEFIYAPEERAKNVQHAMQPHKHQLASFRSEGVQVDAYTMSLLRYASQRTDKYVCEQSCLVQPLYKHVGADQKPRGGHSSSTSVASEGGTSASINHRRSLKVAYLSHDWRDHPMGRLTATLVTGHQQDHSTLSTYHSSKIPHVPNSAQPNVGAKTRISATSVSYGANDKSSIREYVESRSAAFVDILYVHNDIEAAAMLHQRNFDIVVDITGHTYNGRIEIAALRPAPIVINYLGFPGTTGCAGFDYSMVHHAIVPPEIADKLFTERMLYLPYTYQSNDMLLRVAPETQRENGPERGKLVSMQDTRTVNASSDVPVVPDDALLVCSFNANKKMEPVSFHSWMNILLRIPTAVLVLLDVSAETKGHILAQLGFHGLSPHRAVFIPKRNWRRHLMRSAECDLVLDTFVYGAHTTASDVLWMGTPLLSLAAFGSQRMPSRVAASITQALSVPQSCVDSHSSPVEPAHILVVDSIREYEDTAVRYLRSIRSVRNALTRSILHRAVRSAAFDSELMQKYVEFAYQLTYEVRAISSLAQPKVTALPHIFIPDVLSPSREEISGAFQCGVSWEKKFHRDLQQCCDLNDRDLTGMFARIDQSRAAEDSTPATFAKVLSDCYQRKHAAVDSDHSCSSTDLGALLRRLTTAYPTLTTVYGDAGLSQSLKDAGGNEETSEGISGSAVIAAAAAVAAPPGQTIDCATDLTVACTTQLFAHSREDANCRKVTFMSTLRHCYQESAPTVMDFLVSVTTELHEQQQCQAVVSFFEFARPVLFVTSTNEGDSERTSGADLLKSVSSVTMYLSQMWRNLSATDLRTLMAYHIFPPSLHLLKDRRGIAVTSTQYNEYLQYFTLIVRASAPAASVQGYRSESITVCSKFLRAHGIELVAEVEVIHCLNFLTQQLATLVTTHSMCLSQLPADQPTSSSIPSLSASQRAVLDMVAAFMLDPADQRLLNLGTVLMDAHLSEVGYFLSSVAALRKLKALPVEEYLGTKPLIPAARASNSPTGLPSGRLTANDKPRIVFYCDEYGQGWWAGWGPSSFHPQADGSPAKGMGGSEEAVYYTSIELARMGYDVVVYSSVTSADHGSVHYYTADGPLTASVAMQWRGAGNGLQRDVGSVSWLHHNTYNPIPDTSGQQVDSRCEIFIAWRYTISLGLARQPRHFAGCGRKYLWLHDLIPGSILPPSFFLHFDGILVQSEFHKGFIRAAFAPHAATHAYVDMTQVASGIAVIPNGISQSHPMDGANNNAVFIYGSAPGRGLEHVLSQWGTIKKSIPDATLEVYYGFTETALKDLREKLGAGFVRWYEQMQAYLRQDGVKYFGTVDHETLTAAFTRAGFLLYPTTFQETGCITALRAMACGAIPITSRLAPSVLATLTAGHDLGPARPLTLTMAKQPAVLAAWLQEQWTPAVIRAYHMHADELQTRRATMKAMTRETYSWTQTASKLVNLFHDV